MGDDMNRDARATGAPEDTAALAMAQLREEIAEFEAERDRLAGMAHGDILGRLKAKRDRLAALEAERDKRAARLDLRPVGEVYGPEWLTEAPPPRAALLTLGGKPFVVQGKVGLLLAPGGTGKTYALTQLAVAVATGGKWFGTYEATKGRVLLALGEEDAEELQRRLYATAKGLGLNDYERAEVGRNLTVLGMSGRSLALLGRNANGEAEPSKWFREWHAGLAAAGPWRCILLDPWARWGGPDVETDNEAATRGVELLEELTKLPGSPAVLVAHHTRKKGKEEKERGGGADDSRGSSALVDGARWAVNLVRMNDDDDERPLLRLRVTKRNYTAPTPELFLTRDEGAHGVLRAATPAEVAEHVKAPSPAEHGKPPKPEGSTARATKSKGTPGL